MWCKSSRSHTEGWVPCSKIPTITTKQHSRITISRITMRPLPKKVMLAAIKLMQMLSLKTYRLSRRRRRREALSR